MELPDPDGLWERVAEYRFALARGGFQAGSSTWRSRSRRFDSAAFALLTRDRDFERIRTVVPIELDLF